MKVLSRMWKEEDGVLSFEWVMLVTLLTIGIVSGLTGARDAIIDELGWKDRWYMVSAIGRENTWPIMLDVMGFFDQLKAAQHEAAEDAAYRAQAEAGRSGDAA